MGTKSIFAGTAVATGLLVLSGCFGGDDLIDPPDATIEETAQPIGDVVASIDDVGGSTGAIGARGFEGDEGRAAEKLFARRIGKRNFDWSSLFIANAEATSCALATTFGSCATHALTRAFGGCTVGGYAFSGTVAYNWAHGVASDTCALTSVGDYVTRIPNFSVSGRHGAVLTVSATGVDGQKLTYASGAGSNRVMTLESDGIRRLFTVSGTTLFDFTSETTSAMTVTGTNRGSRVLSGGVLRVTNNSTGVTCDLVPASVAWTTNCNCPTTGSWTGTCSNGVNTSLQHTGCGAAVFTLGSTTVDVSLDRCGL